MIYAILKVVIKFMTSQVVQFKSYSFKKCTVNSFKTNVLSEHIYGKKIEIDRTPRTTSSAKSFALHIVFLHRFCDVDTN